MAGSTETITLAIVAKDLASGNISRFIGHMDTVAKRGGILASVFQGVGQHVGQSIGSMLSPTRALTGAIDAGTDAAMRLAEGVFTEYAQGEIVAARLDAALKANIENWNGDKSAIDAVSKSAEHFAFVNDDVENGVADLVVHTHNLNEALEIIPVAMDLARFKGISLQQAAILLGKAYDGNTTSLARMGIKLDKGAKGLDAIRQAARKVAGQAEKTASTFSGRMGAMGASVSNFQEDVGQKLIPVLEDWSNQILGMISNTTHALDVFGGPGKALETVPKQSAGGSTTGNGRPRSARDARRHHATGGLIRDYGYVGETGMERIDVTAQGARVTPLGGHASTAAAPVTVHINWQSFAAPSPTEAQRMARVMGQAVEDELRRRGSLSTR